MGTILENKWAFDNPGGLQFGVVDATTRASAAAMPAPNALITTVSGTVAITSIAVPWTGFTGFIRYIPSGIYTATTAGTAAPPAFPIGLATTAVVGRVMDFTFDGANWWPSY